MPAVDAADVRAAFGLQTSEVRAVVEWLGRAPLGDALTALGRHVLLPLIGYGWLHCGIVQLLAVVFFGATFGRRAEAIVGPWATVGTFVVGVVAGGAVQCWLHPSPVPVLGAGAGVSALIGAHAVLRPRSRIVVLVPVLVVPMRFRLPLWITVAAWFVLQLQPLQELLAPTGSQGVSYAAQGCGLLVGFLAGVAARLPRR